MCTTSAREALQAEKRLTDWLRSVCWKRKKQSSSARKLLEQGYLVLQLHAGAGLGELVEQEVLAEQAIFAHIGYANYKTWKLGVQRLYLRGQSAEDSTKLQLCTGHLCPDALDRAKPRFQTCLDWLTDVMDVHSGWRASLWVIESHAAALPSSEMRSGFVEVSRADVGRPLIWSPPDPDAQRPRQKRSAARRPAGLNPYSCLDHARPTGPP